MNQQTGQPTRCYICGEIGGCFVIDQTVADYVCLECKPHCDLAQRELAAGGIPFSQLTIPYSET